jgi:hypothetical protein
MLIELLEGVQHLEYCQHQRQELFSWYPSQTRTTMQTYQLVPTVD